MCRTLLPLVLLAGCFPRIEPGNSGPGDSASDTDTDADADTDSDTDTDTDTDVDGADARITRLSPEDGSTAGGTEVTLTGTGFGADTQVWFGATEADVLSHTSTELVVEAPAHARGAVDVSVGVGDANDTEDNAFTFWTDASGETEAIVLWSYLESYDGDGETYGLAYPTEPGVFEFYGLWGPTLDSCDGDGVAETTTWGDELYVTETGGGSYTLSLSGSSYTYDDATGAGYDSGETYGFAAPASSENPAFELDPFFTAPNSFTVTTPDIASGPDYYLSGYDLDVGWSGSGGDFVLVWMVGQTSDESLYCIARDDGDFTVDSRYMSRFESLEYVQLSVARFRTAEATLPYDNGLVLGAGMYQFTGFLQVY